MQRQGRRDRNRKDRGRRAALGCGSLAGADDASDALQAPNRFWNVAVPATIAVVFPLLLLLTNSRIPFANDFHCDPWHYFGFFYIIDQQQTIAGCCVAHAVGAFPKSLAGPAGD